MTVPGGTVEALKAELKTLGERRRALEQEVAARAARLEAAGVGMSAALVDREVSLAAAAAHRGLSPVLVIHCCAAMVNGCRATPVRM